VRRNTDQVLRRIDDSLFPSQVDGSPQKSKTPSILITGKGGAGHGSHA